MLILLETMAEERRTATAPELLEPPPPPELDSEAATADTELW